VLGRRAALLKSDGRLMELDGSEGVSISNLIAGGSYHFVIYHRNHLAVMSSSAFEVPNNQMYDFTTGTSKAKGVGQLKVLSGKASIISGDFDGNGTVNFLDFLNWFDVNNTLDQYLSADADMNGTVNFLDFLLWFDNNNIIRHDEI